MFVPSGDPPIDHPAIKMYRVVGWGGQCNGVLCCTVMNRGTLNRHLDQKEGLSSCFLSVMMGAVQHGYVVSVGTELHNELIEMPLTQYCVLHTHFCRRKNDDNGFPNQV